MPVSDTWILACIQSGTVVATVHHLFIEAEVLRFPQPLAYLTSCRCAMLTFHLTLRLKSRCYTTFDHIHTCTFVHIHTQRHVHHYRVAFGREI